MQLGVLSSNIPDLTYQHNLCSVLNYTSTCLVFDDTPMGRGV